MREFREAAFRVMQELEIEMIDLYPMTQNDPSLFGPDGFHLNPEGYRKASDFLIENLRQQGLTSQ